MDTIAAPSSCEVCAVIRFQAEEPSAAEIRRLCRVYGDNVMSDSFVREWCRKFRDGRTTMYRIVTDRLGYHLCTVGTITTD
jgi:hypothetical protein